MSPAPSSPTTFGGTGRIHHAFRICTHPRLPRRASALALVPGVLALLTLSACGVTSVTSAQGATKHCGSVSALTGSSLNASASPANAESCFSQAYTQCAAATLIYTQHGVDTGVTRTFTIQATGSGCSITDTVHSYLVGSRVTPSPDKTYSCKSLQPQHGGLVVLGCGPDGDVLIPAASAA